MLPKCVCVVCGRKPPFWRFLPQSTLSRRIAPFDLRYRYGQRRWDWTTPEFLDAAASVSDAEGLAGL